MKKPRLFICGDSWVNFGYPGPNLHWTNYLENHFEVNIFGLADMDNISITHQLGKLPDFEEGDVIIMVFTEPSRIYRRYMIQKYKKAKIWYDKNVLRRHPSESDLFDLRELQYKLWISNMSSDEIGFYRIIKELLKKYKPLFLTWSPDFYKMTKDFVTLVEVSSLQDEGILQDLHPGIKGCYDFYCKVMELMDMGDEIVNFNSPN